jgi:hypothetical protein
MLKNIIFKFIFRFFFSFRYFLKYQSTISHSIWIISLFLKYEYDISVLWMQMNVTQWEREGQRANVSGKLLINFARVLFPYWVWIHRKPNRYVSLWWAFSMRMSSDGFGRFDMLLKCVGETKLNAFRAQQMTLNIKIPIYVYLMIQHILMMPFSWLLICKCRVDDVGGETKRFCDGFKLRTPSKHPCFYGN